MDFEELICGVCEQHFDNDLHLPRMVPKCGHTFCSQCIEDILDTTSSSNEHIFCCPDDRIIIRLKNRDIGSFPINCLLASLVGKKAGLATDKVPKSASKDKSHLADRKHNASQGLSSTAGSHANVDSSIYSTNQNHYATANGGMNHCMEHGKILEVVCIEDKCKVCSSCALFGSHKNHEIRPEGDVMKEVANRAESIIDLFQIIQKQEKIIMEDHNMKEIERKLNERQDELARMIQDKFKEYINLLKGQERRLLEKLDDKFLYLKEQAMGMTNVSQELMECVSRWKGSAETALTIMSEKSEKGDIAFELLEDRSNIKNDIIVIGEKLAHELNKNQEAVMRAFEGEDQKISVAFNDNFPKILDLLCQITSVKNLEPKFISDISSIRETERPTFPKLTTASNDDRGMNSSRSRAKSPVPDSNMSKRTTEGLDESTFLRNKENSVFTQDPRLLSPTAHFGVLEYKRSEHDTDLLDFELKDLNIAELAESDHVARFAPAEINEPKEDDRDIFRSVRKREWENDDYEVPEALNNVTNRSVLNRSTTEKKAKPAVPRRVEDQYATLSRDASRLFKRSISPLKREQSNERMPKSSRSKKVKEIQVNEKYEPVIEGIMYNIIESADLTGADLGDIGACKLAEFLRTNTKLRSLKLLKNKITDDGCIALANALIHNRSLQTLNLTQNLLTEKTVDAFVELIKTHKNLKTIYFNQNPISLRNVKTKVKELGNMGVSVSI